MLYEMQADDADGDMLMDTIKAAGSVLSKEEARCEIRLHKVAARSSGYVILFPQLREIDQERADAFVDKRPAQHRSKADNHQPALSSWPNIRMYHVHPAISNLLYLHFNSPDLEPPSQNIYSATEDVNSNNTINHYARSKNRNNSCREQLFLCPLTVIHFPWPLSCVVEL
jgi:hypothetical protein